MNRLTKVFLCLAVVLIIGLVILRIAPRPSSGVENVATNSVDDNNGRSPAAINSTRATTNQHSATDNAGGSYVGPDGATRQFAEKMHDDPNYMFKIKIRFYGKVLDESGNPVANANIGFTWNVLKSDSTFTTGQSQTTSDQNGLFSLDNDAQSNGLGVHVSKPGYFTVRADRSFFDYAQPYANNYLTPDANNPVVFHLRKKQNGVPLITSQNPLGNDFAIAIPANGQPIQVNLMERRSGDGPIQISQQKPDSSTWKQATEWSFQMSIPGGGFVEYQNEEFPFEAPENGYQSVIEFDLKKDQPGWAEGINKDYYIEFGNPPVYGRLHIETQIDYLGARLTYAINPDGTRNLEPQ